MLWWTARPNRTPHGYQRSLLAYVTIFVLPTIFVIVPTAMQLEQRAGAGSLWAFLFTTTILGQLLPMLATHGLLAMWKPAVWQRIVTLRKTAYGPGKAMRKTTSGGSAVPASDTLEATVSVSEIPGRMPAPVRSGDTQFCV